jgi:hypothetical protein
VVNLPATSRMSMLSFSRVMYAASIGLLRSEKFA